MADTKVSALTAAGALDGTETVYVVKGGLDRKTTTAEIAASAGAFVSGTDIIQSNSTVTPAAVTELTTSLAPGLYRITGLIVWQSAATTTGASFYVRGNGGTVTRNVGHWYHQ